MMPIYIGLDPLYLYQPRYIRKIVNIGNKIKSRQNSFVTIRIFEPPISSGLWQVSCNEYIDNNTKTKPNKNKNKNTVFFFLV